MGPQALEIDVQSLSNKGKGLRIQAVVREKPACGRLGRTHGLIFIRTVSLFGCDKELSSLWARGRRVYLGRLLA